MKRLLTLIRKEFLQIGRDPSALLISFILPLLLLFIFGYGVNLDSNKISLGLVLEEHSPESLSLAAAFSHSRFIALEVGEHRRALEEKLVSGQLRGLVVVPQSFSANVLSKERSAPVQSIADGSEPNIAVFVHNYTRGILQVWQLHEAVVRGEQPPSLLVGVESRFWYNPELKSRHFLIPGSIAIIMTFTGTLLTALVVAREWERGTMEALMATPVGVVSLLLGKLIPYYILGIASMAMCFSVATLWYDIPFRGSFLALFAASSVFLVAALGQGLLISSATKDQFLAAQLAIISGFLPAFILSGFIFEISAMPLPLQKITLVVAARYFVSLLQTLFLTGNVWPLLLMGMLGMGSIGLVFFLLAAKKTAKRLDL